MNRDANDRRIAAYYARSAHLRAADPLGFKCRYLKGLAIQRDQFQVQQEQPVNVVTLRRRTK
jgi:hypothetical protein